MWLPDVERVDGPLQPEPDAMTPEGRMRGWHVWLVGAPWDGDGLVYSDELDQLVPDPFSTTVEFVPDPGE